MAKLAFNDFVAFMVAWNLWIFWRPGDVRHRTDHQEKNIAYAIGPRADWMHENKLMTTLICHDANGRNDRCVTARLNARKVGAEFRWRAITLDLRDSDPAAVHYRRPGHARKLSPLFDQPSEMNTYNINVFSKLAVGALSGFEYIAILAVNVAPRRATSAAQF